MILLIWVVHTGQSWRFTQYSILKIQYWTILFLSVLGQLNHQTESKSSEWSLSSELSPDREMSKIWLPCLLLRHSSSLLTAFPGCERGLHGFSVQRQHVLADVYLQPQCWLLSTLGSRGWWESVQRHHLVMDCGAGNDWQHSGGCGGLCLCLLTNVGTETLLLADNEEPCTAKKSIFFINYVK